MAFFQNLYTYKVCFEPNGGHLLLRHSYTLCVCPILSNFWYVILWT